MQMTIKSLLSICLLFQVVTVCKLNVFLKLFIFKHFIKHLNLNLKKYFLNNYNSIVCLKTFINYHISTTTN